MSPVPGAKRPEDRIEAIDRFLVASDHQAVAAIEAPHAAAGAAIDIVNALGLECFGPPDVVLVEGVAAVDDGVARIEEVGELRDRRPR